MAIRCGSGAKGVVGLCASCGGGFANRLQELIAKRCLLGFYAIRMGFQGTACINKQRFGQNRTTK